MQVSTLSHPCILVPSIPNRLNLTQLKYSLIVSKICGYLAIAVQEHTSRQPQPVMYCFHFVQFVLGVVLLCVCFVCLLSGCVWVHVHVPGDMPGEAGYLRFPQPCWNWHQGSLWHQGRYESQPFVLARLHPSLLLVQLPSFLSDVFLSSSPDHLSFRLSLCLSVCFLFVSSACPSVSSTCVRLFTCLNLFTAIHPSVCS